MRITDFTLKNWKNFQQIYRADLPDLVYIIGANAAGKSNLLDAFRFLRDISLTAAAKPSAGGLQHAISLRSGLSKIRCLNAKKQNFIEIKIRLEDSRDHWTYLLRLKGEGKGNHRVVVEKEQVFRNAIEVLSRPDTLDRGDKERLISTSLEQTNSNKDFRSIAHFFSATTYLHLVPQLLKFSKEIGGEVLPKDPFGQAFLQRIANTPEKTRISRLKRIEQALSIVVPHFKQLQYATDRMGQPFLKANFEHWRKKGAWQEQNQFSDGTLRLIGLLWALMDGDSLLLLEEPELSLNEEIVGRIPELISIVLKRNKTDRQIFITTHSKVLLSQNSIGSNDVIALKPTNTGTVLYSPTEDDVKLLKEGLSVAETLLPKTLPQSFTPNFKQLMLDIKE